MHKPRHICSRGHHTTELTAGDGAIVQGLSSPSSRAAALVAARGRRCHPPSHPRASRPRRANRHRSSTRDRQVARLTVPESRASCASNAPRLASSRAGVVDSHRTARGRLRASAEPSAGRRQRTENGISQRHDGRRRSCLDVSPSPVAPRAHGVSAPR